MDKITKFDKLCNIINDFYHTNVENIRSHNRNNNHNKPPKDSENNDIIIKLEKTFKKFVKTHLELNKSKSDQTLRISKLSLSPSTFDKQFKKANTITMLSKKKPQGRIIKPSHFFKTEDSPVLKKDKDFYFGKIKKTKSKTKINGLLGKTYLIDGKRNLELKHSNSYYK